jgi:hypothetical protein
MKKLFALLLFLIVPLAPVRAQGLHGKVMLLQYGGSGDLNAALKANYSGQVDSEFTLPSDLSGYEAILMVTPNRVDSGTISILDQQRLIAYIQNGGKFYWEGYFFLTDFFQDTPHDTLARFLGLENESVDDLVYTFERFFGVDSEFTNGFDVGNSYDTLDPEGPGTDFPRGNFTPVLYGEETDGGLDDAIAWIPPDTSIHALMHHAVYFEYYQPFLTRVLCDYFGLCVDAVNEAPLAVPAATLRVVYAGVNTSLVVSSEENGTLDVANALGVTVYRSSVNSGTSQIELPETLRNGVYFARLQTEHGGQVQPFVIVAK